MEIEEQLNLGLQDFYYKQSSQHNNKKTKQLSEVKQSLLSKLFEALNETNVLINLVQQVQTSSNIPPQFNEQFNNLTLYLPKDFLKLKTLAFTNIKEEVKIVEENMFKYGLRSNQIKEISKRLEEKSTALACLVFKKERVWKTALQLRKRGWIVRNHNNNISVYYGIDKYDHNNYWAKITDDCKLDLNNLKFKKLKLDILKKTQSVLNEELIEGVEKENNEMQIDKNVEDIHSELIYIQDLCVGYETFYTFKNELIKPQNRELCLFVSGEKIAINVSKDHEFVLELTDNKNNPEEIVNTNNKLYCKKDLKNKIYSFILKFRKELKFKRKTDPMLEEFIEGLKNEFYKQEIKEFLVKNYQSLASNNDMSMYRTNDMKYIFQNHIHNYPKLNILEYEVEHNDFGFKSNQQVYMLETLKDLVIIKSVFPNNIAVKIQRRNYEEFFFDTDWINLKDVTELEYYLNYILNH